MATPRRWGCMGESEGGLWWPHLGGGGAWARVKGDFGGHT